MAATLKPTASAALATFVKTPELSPVKTRLAADIGKTAAHAVYEESVALTAALMSEAADVGLCPYWAVGEKEALSHPRWKDFPALWTGDGGLGARLFQVYSTLRQQHGRVVLIGADSPQLTAATVAAAAARHGDTVIGAATDGGFYLFAADDDIPRQIWESVEYSRTDTLKQLQRHVTASLLPALTDIDDAASLAQVIEELKDKPQNAARLRRLLPPHRPPAFPALK